MRVFVIKCVNLILIAAVLWGYQGQAQDRQQQKLAYEEKAQKQAAARQTVAAETAAPLRDGTYEGSGTGFGGEIRVQLRVAQGRIASAKVVSAKNETPEYLKEAKGVLEEVVAQQTDQVDTVSGATLSSNGILEAVRQAMEKCNGK